MRSDREMRFLEGEVCPEMLKALRHVDCFGAAFAGTSLAVAAGSATAANLALVGTLVSVAGTVMAGQQAASQAKFQAGVANNNAIVAQQQADRAAQQGRIDEDDFKRQQSDLFASRRSLFGKTNVEATSGAPLAVSRDFAGASALSALRLRNQGEVNVNALQNSVRQQRSQAGLFAQQGRAAVTSSAFRAGGTLFNNASRLKFPKPSQVALKAPAFPSK